MLDWSTGQTVYSAPFGAIGLNLFLSTLSIHPAQEVICGFLSGSSNQLINPFCDLDPSRTDYINYGDTDASPGTQTNWWSAFPFCWNVNSTALPFPTWTHTISATTNDQSLTRMWNQKTAWAGSDMVVAAATRQSSTQGLIWPASGTITTQY